MFLLATTPPDDMPGALAVGIALVALLIWAGVRADKRDIER